MIVRATVAGGVKGATERRERDREREPEAGEGPEPDPEADEADEAHEPEPDPDEVPEPPPSDEPRWFELVPAGGRVSVPWWRRVLSFVELVVLVVLLAAGVAAAVGVVALAVRFLVENAVS